MLNFHNGPTDIDEVTVEDDALRKILECPVCLEMKCTVKYYACENGHTVCGRCKIR